jgi:hypothetical protein
MPAPDPTRPKWRKSTHSSDKANCIEVLLSGPTVGVRDSKDSHDTSLTFPALRWADFIASLTD